MPRQTELPEFELLDVYYGVLDPEVHKESVRLAVLLCTRIGCERPFVVEADEWCKLHLSEIRQYEITGRACPYCFAASKIPLKLKEMTRAHP